MKGYEDLVKLVKHVAATGGLDCDEKSICDYQDMIGHSSIEQLQELSNGTYQHAYYRVYGAAAGVIEAIKFYCQNSEKIMEILKERDGLLCDVEDLREDLQKKQDTAEKFHIGFLEAKKETETVKKDLEAAQAEISQRDEEIRNLKAKLYDLMTA